MVLHDVHGFLVLVEGRQPDVSPWEDGLYVLDRSYRYRLSTHDRQTGRERGFIQWQIGKGFLYDGASVPRLLWTLTGLLPDGLIREAALVHDHLYRHRGHKILPRRTVDLLFYRMMRRSGVPVPKAAAAYLAVRLGGWLAW